MYKSFYNLKKKPFQISSDPKFMWMGEKHKEALAVLKYGVMDNKGFLLLTGDVGTGKTTLINALIENLSDDIIFSSVPDPSLEKLDFLNFIGTAFGIEKEFSSKGAFLANFRNFLTKAYEDGKTVLLIIDESQLLTQEMLEEIRLLSNIERTDVKLINIFFIGQNEFNDILNLPQNRAVRQRLTLNYNIEPLTASETFQYIRHRMKVAGSLTPIFEASAITEIFNYSGGFPRRINVLCDHCLLSGFVKERKSINSEIVLECAKELSIPLYSKTLENENDSKSKNQEQGGNNPAQQGDNQPKSARPRFYWGIEALQDRFNPVSGFLLAIAVVVILWFLFFPSHFSDSLSRVKNNVITYKHNNYDDQIDYDPRLEKPEPVTPPEPVEVPESTSPEVVNDVEQPDVAPVDNTSAPAPEPEVETEPETPEVLPLPKEKILVRFKHDTTDMNDKDLDALNEFAEALKTHPETRILISGYTDSEGVESYNKKISEFRANIVKSFFMGKGIISDQITVVGLGGQNPIQSNDSAWGRMMNRRVEVEIIE